MTRPLRLELPGAVYHVTARGVARSDIFGDDRDRLVFLAVFRDVLDRFGWECITYCLMPNHYHLVVRTPQPNLARGMRQLNGVYVQRFNRRHERSGPLFDKRYGSVLVQQNDHLLNLIRYVVHNPVSAGLCSTCDDWPWSGHRELIGACERRLITRPALAELLGAPADHFAGAYRDLVAHPGTEPRRDVAVLGEPDFVERMLSGNAPSEAIAARNWSNGRPPLGEVLDPSDPGSLVSAYRTFGYTLAEIGAELGIHSSTVSKHLRAAERE